MDSWIPASAGMTRKCEGMTRSRGFATTPVIPAPPVVIPTKVGIQFFNTLESGNPVPTQRLYRIKISSFIVCLATLTALFVNPAFSNSPVIYSLELLDANPTPNQGWQDIIKYTNDTLIQVRIIADENTAFIYLSEEPGDLTLPVEYIGETYYFLLEPQDREATVYCMVTDKNGRESDIECATIILDTVRPETGKFFYGDGDPFHNKPDILVCWDGFSDNTGISGYYLSSGELGIDNSWTTHTCRIFINLSDGPYYLNLHAQDPAGNISPALKGCFCIDTLAPIAHYARVDFGEGTGCSSKNSILIQWSGFYDTSTCPGNPGICGYSLIYYLDDELFPPDSENNPHIVYNSNVLWKNVPEGQLSVKVRAHDSAGNVSPPAIAGITSDRTNPLIMLLGFMDTTISEETGGFISIIALSPFEDAERIFLYYLDEDGNILPTGISLNDKGRFGDEVAGDWLYSFAFSAAEGNPAGTYLIIAVAVDQCLNINLPWPFLWVAQ